MVLLLYSIPKCADYRHHHAARELHEEDKYDDTVHQELHLALLVPSTLRVFHQLRIVARKNCESYYPLSVFQNGSFEQHLLRSQRVRFATTHQLSLVAVELFARSLTRDRCIRHLVGCHISRRKVLSKPFRKNSLFQGLFTI